MAEVRIRDAVPTDLGTIHTFICELADYERLRHEVTATPELLHGALFGPKPRAFALICESDREPVGFALCFYNFSTFKGRPGIYLEDLYVREAFRGRGIGKAVFKELARRAVDEGCARVEWAVLNWNEPALKFYKSLGAAPMNDWQVQRLTGAALESLAA